MFRLFFLILLLIPQICFADVGGWFGQGLEQHNNVDNSTTPSNGQLLKYNSITEQWEFNDLTITFVPYTGATANLDLGSYSITATNCTVTGTGTSEIPSLEVTTTLNIPHSVSLPATCVIGDIYMDTDATSGQRYYLCESTDTWVLQGDGSVSDTAYAASWDGVTTISPSKNAVYDKIETLAGGHDAVTVTDSSTINFTLTAQDITAAFLPAGVNSATWGDGTQTSMVWSSNLSGADDPTITFGNALVSISGAIAGTSLNITDETIGYQIDDIRILSRFTNVAGNNYFLGESGNFTMTGEGNVGIGELTLINTTTGIGNFALGKYALYWNTTGKDNVAIGTNSLVGNTEGIANVGIGWAALLSNTTGDNNVSIGEDSLRTNIIGDENVSLGYRSGYNTIGSNNIFLGAYAGFYETGSNAFYVNNQDRINTAGDKAGALLYGVFNATPASQTLTVNAATTISNNLTLGTGKNFTIGATQWNSADEIDGTKIKDGTVTYTAMVANVPGLPHHTHISIVNPNAVVTASTIIPIWTLTNEALTVTKITVSTSSASYEAAGDLKYADARIGLANATVIETFDTISGVRVDSSIASGAVASGKFMYLSFDSAPSASMTDFIIDIDWDYD